MKVSLNLFYIFIRIPKWYIITYWYVGSIGAWIFGTQSGKPDTPGEQQRHKFK